MRRADVRARGFTLVEVLVVLVIVAVLALFAWPAFHTHWLRARRVDGHLALMQLQQHQARWRSDHPGYATAAELGTPATSPEGHYRLSVHDPDGTGYLLRAEAQGSQRADTGCAVLVLRLEQAHTSLQSHTAAGAENQEPANRRCWSR